MIPRRDIEWIRSSNQRRVLGVLGSEPGPNFRNDLDPCRDEFAMHLAMLPADEDECDYLAIASLC